ncbi:MULTISPECIES: TIGR01777 family oxidoreductase [Actinokineospora]|uniref:Multidrug MFS transporter n=1 Tax=Actinokineospora fastidiosa TaxID=1816 RepID=A0A918GIW5_9PSEU|nr:MULTISPECIES: TIGR01777 family oxidoreductase [Actinokineospora]UVS77819.1 Epimerase family protein [Actinokineospora sp. UTMC 2448]GGS40790.1 multidrug MFS transporter [Actinokineospora fastidiosa]
MRVVVAGASGFIGTALVARLRRDGHDVARLVRRAPMAGDERGWDPPAGKIDPGALDGADAVVNLCGAPMWTRRWTGARKQALVDSRVEPTEVLAAAVAEHGVPVLLNQSATGYYGDTSGTVDESGPQGAGFTAELCARWEHATAGAGDARVVRMRTGPVLADHGGMLGPIRPFFALGLGGRLGSGRQHMPWIHLDDAIAAMLFLLRADIAGPVNLVGPTPATNTEFTRAFAETRRRPAPFFVPKAAMRLAMGELADDALRDQRVLPKVLLDNGFRFTYPTVRDALAATEGR